VARFVARRREGRSFCRAGRADLRARRAAEAVARRHSFNRGVRGELRRRGVDGRARVRPISHQPRVRRERVARIALEVAQRHVGVPPEARVAPSSFLVARRVRM